MGYRRFRRSLPLGDRRTSSGTRRSGFMARGVGEEEGFKNEVEHLDMHRVENSIFGFREFSGKSEFPTRRVSSDAEGDKIEVAKLASFGSESNRTDDFWTRESWN